ncbi:MAG: hypothetical protein K5682_04570 [Lachnospiraceae bacterium]|nr:hypothetical protein [Lachnospiraceae bacterium]
MHVMIINGSPRVKQFSNTDKILEEFTKGMCENGTTFEQYEISDRRQWDAIREAYYQNENILIALPLYVECIPGLLMEFLETLHHREDKVRLSFILQSGFAEGIQLRCGEAYLEKLAGRLGCEYGGTLVKGDNFSIRLLGEEQRKKVTGPYENMGREFGKQGNFLSDTCRSFTGPEVFPAYVRWMLSLIFQTFAKKGFNRFAKSWGCKEPLDYKPYE